MSDQAFALSRDRYRIVTDRYSGFEVQTRRWWWPLWQPVGGNTHATVDDAIAYARRDARKKNVVVAELGRLPIEVPPAATASVQQRQDHG
jgi:hypothetical protein